MYVTESTDRTLFGLRLQGNFTKFNTNVEKVRPLADGNGDLDAADFRDSDDLGLVWQRTFAGSPSEFQKIRSLFSWEMGKNGQKHPPPPKKT